MTDDFITNYFFEICGICSLIVTIGIFLFYYVDFKKNGFIKLNIHDILWCIVFILFALFTIIITICIVLINTIVMICEAKFWKKNVIIIRKKVKKNEEKKD